MATLQLIAWNDNYDMLSIVQSTCACVRRWKTSYLVSVIWLVPPSQKRMCVCSPLWFGLTQFMQATSNATRNASWLPQSMGYLRDLYQTPGFGSTTNHFHIEHHYQVSSLLHMATHVVGTYTYISIFWDQPPLLVCGTWKCCLDKWDYPASLVCYATNDILMQDTSPSWASLTAFCLLFIGCRKCPPNLELALDTAVYADEQQQCFLNFNREMFSGSLHGEGRVTCSLSPHTV